MIQQSAKVNCDYRDCDKITDMIIFRHHRTSLDQVMLPDGWVSLDQGLGPNQGFGTSDIPAEVDVFIIGSTFCSAAHCAWEIMEKLRVQTGYEPPNKVHD